jgi:hypothetical protein
MRPAPHEQYQAPCQNGDIKIVNSNQWFARAWTFFGQIPAMRLLHPFRAARSQIVQCKIILLAVS